MNHPRYPLGHDVVELDRLDSQALLLHDPLLDELASNATSCLEIGCGNGSNLPLLQRANPRINYMGIDISPQAISAAKLRYHQSERISFHVMDAASIKSDKKFDLIFIKLVLWSVGPLLHKILSEVRRLLVPGGTFYVLEPCNQLIQFYPAKPSVTEWMRRWDEAAIQRGLNPYIGPTIAGDLQQAGLTLVDSKFFPVLGMGSNPQKYISIVDNLKGFYMGPAAENFGLTVSDHELKTKVLNELDSFSAESVVMDALFVTWARYLDVS